ncbi:alpha-hydroxy acid oxidase [Rhodalgimonas zhirmunskyi]|uniref:Alpha-hydroxy-acid oxidizing protein n=1 Tax=Rhodalgimonas zhirmunskyi TaxID=2964767 RepID=A0AAJ1X3M8_9RHOB|nr:alpha-hydroxy acid oxidase [Rhodoalgimonas zhirmunskyi]MDQ2093458.1 alpha-hydroxy-acid oxidizing protein [Rhodoalgimonas zhirmunskyi]
MDLMTKYPAVTDLQKRARARIPHFAYEYLVSGTGAEATTRRNRTALDQVQFMPAILRGPQTPDLSVQLFGETLPLPFGIAPVGLSGIMWPDAEYILAQAAAREGIPYSLSTVAAQTPEHVAPVLGKHSWFQLYPPKSPEIRRDMLKRARDAGFTGVAITVDVPVASRRERQTRSGLTHPPRMTPRILWQIARRPAWALATAKTGAPRMRTLDKYVTDQPNLPPTEHIGYLLRTSPDMDYIRAIRADWDGHLMIKGVMDPEDAKSLENEGVDAIWLSNHAGRQFDASPATIEVLPEMRRATSLPIIFDSGVEGGLDILRALALGADFVMLGRAWQYAVGALGPDGPAHLAAILRNDLISNMGQLGVEKFADLQSRLRIS